MSDIVERLRAWSPLVASEFSVPAPALVMDDAAAEIERLRAQIEALAGCMAQIERAAAGTVYSQEMIHAMALVALKALEAKP